MPEFSYLALDEQGREQYGSIEAVNEREAANALRNQSIYVLSINEGYANTAANGSSSQKILAALKPRQYLPVRSNDLVFLFRQISLMLGSGHTVVQALEANQEMTSKNKLRRSLVQMGDDIQSGVTLSQAMRNQSSTFPPMVNKLLEAGEQSGEIDAILERLADDLERRQDIKRQLATALTYPGIVFFMAVGVSVALVGWVIPRFARFLNTRDVALPPITQMLLDISDWFQNWGGTLGAGVFIVIFGILAVATTKKGKRIIDGVLIKVPVIGKVIVASGMAQASWTLSMQLNSGITLLNGLRITRDIMGNQKLAQAFDDASEKILAGQPLSIALRKKGIPDLVTHMAAIGEKSGELDGVMSALGEFYRKDLQGRVKSLAAWVEPLLIIFVGGLVAVVYLAFFQAALSVSSGGM